MSYDVDNEYEFKLDETGLPVLPDGLTMEGNLYVLPSGKFLPRGTYRTNDGGHLIYEPPQLSPFADMIADFRK